MIPALPSPLKINGKQLVIFSDYDGTITQEDAIVQTMKRFAPPEWKTIATAILETRTLSIYEGIQQLYGLLPKHQKQAIIDFNLAHIPLRTGFEQLMQFCKQYEIPFWVVSGGVDAFIAPKLAPWAEQLQLFANGLDDATNHTYLQLKMPYIPKQCEPCGHCACCKVQILDQWATESYYRIVIGDSVTDLGMTKVACKVYAVANSSLHADCVKLGITHHPFETFDEVVADLKRLTGCL
jgi:2-hydroxy-3-keto-5-methylthiopentenyl-1-phosphate phosphatase